MYASFRSFVSSPLVRAPLMAALLVLMMALPAVAAQSQQARLAGTFEPGAVFPGADRFSDIKGEPPARTAFKDGEPVGYVFVNTDVASAIGYSGKPIHVAVGVRKDGTITGTKLLEHHEPIVLIGIPEKRIRAFLDHYEGRNVNRMAEAGGQGASVDIITGATVTVRVIDASITGTAVKLLRRRSGKGATETGPRRVIDTALRGTTSWQNLRDNKAVRRLHLTYGEVDKAFEKAGKDRARRRRHRRGREKHDRKETLIDLYVAQVSVPMVGRSLLGAAEYENLRKRLDDGQQAILVVANGPYSFKGSGYVRGGIFDRIQVLQGPGTIRFRDVHHKRLRRVAARGAPDFDNVDVFEIPENVDFDATAPWRFQLLVQRAIGPTKKTFITFDREYRVPDPYVKTIAREKPDEAGKAAAAAAGGGDGGGGGQKTGPQSLTKAVTGIFAGGGDKPLWQRLWQNRLPAIGATLAVIAVVTAAFFLQDQLVRRPRLYRWGRRAVLAFVLVYLGWMASAQLSVVNIFTFVNSLMGTFSWNQFLRDPLMFLLWFSVAAALLFWGRGAYCGWLCPFGALQELLHEIARRLRIPQITLPWGLHERLWALKYLIFLGLFAVSLYSVGQAERLAEVEPFKTAIILGFDRAWPFVLYAVALLVAGLFINRFFCRYLCPLGAGLAIPARLAMFDWLKRWPECGRPCQRCGDDCPVGAIHPSGHINPNECIQCFNCQELYYDEHRCPHMIQQRLKRERREQRRSGAAPAGSPAHEQPAGAHGAGTGDDPAREA